MSALIVGAALTTFGGMLGYFSAVFKDTLERRRRRRVLATALLVELRWLNTVLREVRDGGLPLGDPFHHPVLEAALRDLGLFDEDAAVSLAHFRVLLLDVQHDTRAGHSAQAESDSLKARLLAASVRVKSTYAANALTPLKSALLKAGGTQPPPLQELPVTDTLPVLLPSPFELFSAPESERTAGPPPATTPDDGSWPSP